MITRKIVLLFSGDNIAAVGTVTIIIITSVLLTHGATALYSSTQPNTISSSSSHLMWENYSGRLTSASSFYARTNYDDVYYYQAIEVTVPVAGSYSFKSISPVDMYGYLYINNFDPTLTSDNFLEENDDDGGSRQFLIQYTLRANTTYILVVTTFSIRVVAAFSVVVQGPASARFLTIDETITRATPVSISLIETSDVVYGIYDTTAGRSSLAATRGSNIGNYPPAEPPANAIDNDVRTKYLNFGACNPGQSIDVCGVNSGFYLTLRRGSSTVIGFQICTASDRENRDPITVTIEGSNQSGMNLTLGRNWNLIYSGLSGLSNDLGRNKWGIRRYFVNLVQYASYRFLVTSKRAPDSSVQYAEVQFFGV